MNAEGSVEEIVRDRYLAHLRHLKTTSRPLIDSLTLIAKEYAPNAQVVAQTIESRLKNVRAEHKLPILYLMDSITKNVKGEYPELFSNNIVLYFSNVYEEANDKIRLKLFKLRQTWDKIFPQKKLHALDVVCNSIDSSWYYQAPKMLPNPDFSGNASPAQAPSTSQAGSDDPPVKPDAPDLFQMELQEEQNNADVLSECTTEDYQDIKELFQFFPPSPPSYREITTSLDFEGFPTLLNVQDRAFADILKVAKVEQEKLQKRIEKEAVFCEDYKKLTKLQKISTTLLSREISSIKKRIQEMNSPQEIWMHLDSVVNTLSTMQQFLDENQNHKVEESDVQIISVEKVSNDNKIVGEETISPPPPDSSLVLKNDVVDLQKSEIRLEMISPPPPPDFTAQSSLVLKNDVKTSEDENNKKADLKMPRLTAMEMELEDVSSDSSEDNSQVSVEATATQNDKPRLKAVPLLEMKDISSMNDSSTEDGEIYDTDVDEMEIQKKKPKLLKLPLPQPLELSDVREIEYLPTSESECGTPRVKEEVKDVEKTSENEKIECKIPSPTEVQVDGLGLEFVDVIPPPPPPTMKQEQKSENKEEVQIQSPNKNKVSNPEGVNTVPNPPVAVAGPSDDCGKDADGRGIKRKRDDLKEVEVVDILDDDDDDIICVYNSSCNRSSGGDAPPPRDGDSDSGNPAGTFTPEQLREIKKIRAKIKKHEKLADAYNKKEVDLELHEKKSAYIIAGEHRERCKELYMELKTLMASFGHVEPTVRPGAEIGRKWFNCWAKTNGGPKKFDKRIAIAVKHFLVSQVPKDEDDDVSGAPIFEDIQEVLNKVYEKHPDLRGTPGHVREKTARELYKTIIKISSRIDFKNLLEMMPTVPEDPAEADEALKKKLEENRLNWKPITHTVKKEKIKIEKL